MEIVGLIGRVVERIFAWLPSWVIRSKFPPAKIAEAFFIELGSPRGVQIILQAPSSRVSLYLRAVNLSPIWVETERFDFQVAIGNQELYSGQIFKRRRVNGLYSLPRVRVWAPRLGHGLLVFRHCGGLRTCRLNQGEHPQVERPVRRATPYSGLRSLQDWAY